MACNDVAAAEAIEQTPILMQCILTHDRISQATRVVQPTSMSACLLVLSKSKHQGVDLIEAIGSS